MRCFQYDDDEDFLRVECRTMLEKNIEPIDIGAILDADRNLSAEEKFFAGPYVKGDNFIIRHNDTVDPNVIVKRFQRLIQDDRQLEKS